MKKSTLVVLLFLSIFYFLLPSISSAEYNELYDSAGQLRPQYHPFKDLVEALANDSSNKNQASISQSGVFSVSPQPIILTPSQSQLLQQGIAQRARAMLMFLKDHYSGNQIYLKKNLIPSSVVQAASLRQKINPKNIDFERLSFIYGPDLLKINQEEFVVLEDNPTVPGGIVQSHLIHKHMINKIPSLSAFTEPYPTFLESLMAFLKSKSSTKKVVVLRYEVPEVLKTFPKAKAYLDAKKLWHSQVKEFGFEIVSVNPLHTHGSYDSEEKLYKKLSLNAEGELVLLTRKSRWQEWQKELVGSVYLDILPTHLQSWWGASAVLKAWKNKKIYLSHTPGVELLDDKVFTPYVEKMVEFYLQEQPLIRAPQTLSFASENGSLNLKLMQNVQENLDRWVIKKTTGEGGKFVYIGKDLAASSNMLDTVLSLIQKAPEQYIAQEFIESSYFGHYMLDYRPYGIADQSLPLDLSGSAKGKAHSIIPVIVAEQPYSRAVDRRKSSKHNVSSNVGSAYLQGVFVQKQISCLNLF